MSHRRKFVQKTLLALAGCGILPQFDVAATVSRSSAHVAITGDKDDLRKVQELLKGKDPVKWVFTGDSITQGAKHTFGYRSYPEIFAERVRWELGRVRDFVINTAISGHTSRDILQDYDWRIGQFNPTVVSLMIGTNDASVKKEISVDAFRQNNLKLVEKIRSAGALPILQTPNIVIREKAIGRERLDEYISATRKIAEEQDVILVDHWKFWNEELQKHPEGELFQTWLNDELHPNGHGHSKMAHQLFTKLSIFDPNAFTCNEIK